MEVRIYTISIASAQGMFNFVYFCCYYSHRYHHDHELLGHIFVSKFTNTCFDTTLTNNMDKPSWSYVVKGKAWVHNSSNSRLVLTGEYCTLNQLFCTLISDWLHEISFLLPNDILCMKTWSRFLRDLVFYEISLSMRSRFLRDLVFYEISFSMRSHFLWNEISSTLQSQDLAH